jgi:hypothetical protein
LGALGRFWAILGDFGRFWAIFLRKLIRSPCLYNAVVLLDYYKSFQFQLQNRAGIASKKSASNQNRN